MPAIALGCHATSVSRSARPAAAKKAGQSRPGACARKSACDQCVLPSIGSHVSSRETCVAAMRVSSARTESADTSASGTSASVSIRATCAR